MRGNLFGDFLMRGMAALFLMSLSFSLFLSGSSNEGKPFFSRGYSMRGEGASFFFAEPLLNEGRGAFSLVGDSQLAAWRARSASRHVGGSEQISRYREHCDQKAVLDSQQ